MLAIPVLSILGALFIAALLEIGARRKPSSETYTVTLTQMGQHLGTVTNVIEVTNCTPHCKAIVFVQTGMTNIFHAWMVNVEVKTNQILEKK